MARIVQAYGEAGQDFAHLFIAHPFHVLDGAHRVVDRVKRFGIAVPVPAAALGVVFGQRGRILQEHPAEFDGGLMGEDRPPEAALHEERDTTGVVDMAMAEDDGVDRLRVEGKRLTVHGLVLGSALHQAAIEENRITASPDDMAGTGHATGRPVEFKFHEASFSKTFHMNPYRHSIVYRKKGFERCHLQVKNVTERT